MTYNVFSGMLSLTQSINQSIKPLPSRVQFFMNLSWQCLSSLPLADQVLSWILEPASAVHAVLCAGGPSITDLPPCLVFFSSQECSRQAQIMISAANVNCVQQSSPVGLYCMADPRSMKAGSHTVRVIQSYSTQWTSQCCGIFLRLITALNIAGFCVN